MTSFERNRDYYAGVVVALIGAGAIAQGISYGVGNLYAMGSGFFPVALGTGMILLGILMAVFRAPSNAAHAASPPDWRGALAIALAVVLFILLAGSAGLLPAIFACVFVGALGTRTTTLREAAILAACVAIFGVLLFSLGLKIQFPILRGVL